MEAPLLRALRPGERERVLALLDGWPFSDGWRGRDFFRRFMDWDPSYRDDNFLVAEQGGELVACVQIFPRWLRVPGAAVPVGGIGSVFTRPEARASGVASALLRRAQDVMRKRGLELSLLFASRHAFYARLGWELWPSQRQLLLRSDTTVRPDAARAGTRFVARRDLPEVMALHAEYSGRLAGTLVRDPASWRGSLRLAGNPGEDFVVARDAAGELVAYARGVVLEGVYLLAEWGRRAAPAAAEALADLVTALLHPRDPDPLASGARPSGALRQVLVCPPVADAPLFAALAGRDVDAKHFEGRDAMLCCLDARALAQRLGAPAPGAHETPGCALRRLLPARALAFWPADRF